MKELLAAVLNEDENGNFTLAFHSDDHNQETVRVDKMLSALLQARLEMTPPPSLEVTPPGTVVQAIYGVAWRVEPTLSSDLALKLYHPALGWLTWAVPAQTAAEIGGWLLKLAAAAEAPPEQVQ